ncbi:MAG: hypothetical protein V4530_02925 [Pseudomonadota bacterium]
MMLGLSLAAFTDLHTIISLIAIAVGLVWLAAYLRGRWLARANLIFLVLTILTVLTGFLFPFKGVTPAVAVGILCTGLLAIAVLALARGRTGIWRPVYTVTAILSLYFNCFVLVVQSFQKVPFLHTFAPTGSEPPFAVAQGIVLIAFAWAGWRAFRHPV